ncbi:B1 protein [Tribolium castaneum]|uniref:B1 protein n=1 Tax=Tribolium castaneum TaxID=7070 RepID=UPI0030FE697C
MNIYTCLVLVVIAASAQHLTEEQKNNWRKWSNECKVLIGVSQEAINKIRNNEFDSVDDKIKKHGLCFAKKASLADSSGNIIINQIKIKLKRVIEDDEEVDRIVTKCTVRKNTPEETTFETFRCLRENSPKFVPV